MTFRIIGFILYILYIFMKNIGVLFGYFLNNVYFCNKFRLIADKI